jgi:hypothetical protein
MQIAVCVQAEFRRTVEAMGQFLAGITQRLEVPDGVGMVERGHGVNNPGTILALRARGCDGQGLSKRIG